MRLTILLILAVVPRIPAADRPLWNLAELSKPPKVEWLDASGALRKLIYESELLNGKPTRVFAYYGEPQKLRGKAPAMVLVHGGGGKAFPEWVQRWNQRGYIAIAMDLGGNGPDGKRLVDGGPGQDDGSKLPVQPVPLKTIWTYHAIAAVIRANSLLRSMPNVDAERIGITGISWGGYLTCIAAGVDDRFKVAVPVYGCGFLHENSVWLNRFAKMPENWRAEWVKHFDPSAHVGNAKMPVLFVNGTNDFAYPLDSYQKTYRLVKDRMLCVKVNMPHSHPAGWEPQEIDLFVDSHLLKRESNKREEAKGLPLFQIMAETREENGELRVFVRVPQFMKPTIPADANAKGGIFLHWTTDLDQPWQKRKWQTRKIPCMPGNATDFYVTSVPMERPVVYFLTAVDERGATTSTEHITLTKK